MSETVIKVENLGKKYLIRHEKRERYTALRDVMAIGVKRMFNRGIVQPFKRLTSNSTNQQFNDLTSASLSNSTFQQSSSSTTEEFWALKDINFEVKRGERVGIIGRNGAGKTTLLKLLSRITEPTTGRITLKGRVASLLEVGTGFHPELTGRENIFLNGAILGMSKAEIKKKFDEIVDFAEIEKFLDTPVKRYSSGMYVRLAFAVAAHLEPEILIVDEVLAVGDAQFQKKCLGKMGEVSKEGRTILFVSHNMSAIQSLCERSLILNKGCLSIDGPTDLAVQHYLKDPSISYSFNRMYKENKELFITAGRLINSNNQTTNGFIQVEVQIHSKYRKEISLDVRLKDELGNPVGYSSLGTLDSNERLFLSEGNQVVSFTLFVNQLAVGKYLLSLDLNVPYVQVYDRAENCLSFEVTRPPSPEKSLVLQQSWRYGCYEFPLKFLYHNKNDKLYER
ncbi:MAG: ABC transporter ATP-binding protein [Thermodesulfovibrionales bacterium]